MSHQNTNGKVPSKAKYSKFIGGDNIDVIEKEVPSPGKGQLLIQTKCNSLCGSDFPLYHDGSDITPGHEAAGIVVQAGPMTTNAVGTPGVIFLMDFCGECRNCKKGSTNQCLQKRADYGFTNDGGYGSYILINENVFFTVPENLPLPEATLLLDIMGTGGHALMRSELVHDDPYSLLVLGAGPIGLGILAMAKIKYGKDFPVLITDLIPYRLNLAEKLGGLPINLKETSLKAGIETSLKAGIENHGFSEVDVAIDACGKEVAKRDALDMLAQKGVLVCVGHGQGLSLTISPDMIATERAIIGSEYFCYDEIAPNLELLQNNREYLEQIITHRYPISKLKEAFDFLIAGDSGKVIVEY